MANAAQFYILAKALPVEYQPKFLELLNALVFKPETKITIDGTGTDDARLDNIESAMQTAGIMT